MAISKLRSPRVHDIGSAQKAIDETYRALNILIDAVNQFGDTQEGIGKAGGIRITEKGIEAKTDKGWRLVPFV